MENTANPIIQKENSLPVPANKFSLIKIIYLVVIGIIILELVYAGWLFLNPTQKSDLRQGAVVKNTETPSPALILSSNQKTVKSGDKIDIKIIVSTAGKVIEAADVQLNYDPALLSLEGSASAMFKPGKIFNDYPLKDFSQKGVVRISAISGLNKPGVSGIGTFGGLTFKAQQNGKTRISLDYQPNTTTDSNLIEKKSAQDILSKVTDLELEIK